MRIQTNRKNTDPFFRPLSFHSVPIAERLSQLNLGIGKHQQQFRNPAQQKLNRYIPDFNLTRLMK
jgi:hypothetical protein